MEIFGYIAALFIGVSLGLIGGGGSILTVPVLVYLFGISPVLATSYSLFIVGITSLIGTFNFWRNDAVDLKTALLFGMSSILSVFITRKFIIHAIPEQFSIAGMPFRFSVITMVLFAMLMLLASINMIRSKERENPEKLGSKSLGMMLIYGIAIGLVTGFLGAGGGFLLIPVLVLILGLPMRTAIGTSLLIIAMNSLIGFVGDIGKVNINWILLLVVSLIAIVGVLTGSMLGKKMDGAKLKKGFGWFVLVMGIAVIAKELFFRG